MVLHFPPNTGRLGGDLFARDSEGKIISNCIRATILMLGIGGCIIADVYPLKMKGNAKPVEVLGKIASIVRELSRKQISYLNSIHNLECISSMGGAATDFLRGMKKSNTVSDDCLDKLMIPTKATLHPEFIFGSLRCYLFTLEQAKRSCRNIAEFTGKPCTYWVDLLAYRSQDPHWEEYKELQRLGRVRGGRRKRTYVYVFMFMYP
jgi:hypothetical protein